MGRDGRKTCNFVVDDAIDGAAEKIIVLLFDPGFPNFPNSPLPPETRSFLREIWCRLEDLNPRPTDYKSVALPTELSRPKSQILLVSSILSVTAENVPWRHKPEFNQNLQVSCIPARGRIAPTLRVSTATCGKRHTGFVATNPLVCMVIARY